MIFYGPSRAGTYRMAHEVGDGISRDRIVSLTDAVLAIVMTLLVLEIAVRSHIDQKLQLSFQNDYLSCCQLFGAMQQVS